MWSKYHREITKRALASQISPRALRAVVRANLGQDVLAYQFNHDHFHFDGNQFVRSYDYMETQRALIRPALERGDHLAAWRAFGKLTHSAQDFYAHSDYIPRWLARFNGGPPPPAPEVDPVSADLVHAADLRSGKLYYPLEILAYVSPLRRFVLPFLPADSHAHMNMDGPDISPLFEYAYHAAIKRTMLEFEKTRDELPSALIPLFTDSGAISDQPIAKS